MATLLDSIAQQHTNGVIYHSVSLAIEKIAETAAQEILSDPDFKAELKAIARESVRRAFRDLRAPAPAKRKRAKS